MTEKKDTRKQVSFRLDPKMVRELKKKIFDLETTIQDFFEAIALKLIGKK